MKRKSRPLITGGLLGLAGLGLLPSRAEATPDRLAPAPDPSLGEALAVDPHPVVVPEPSAQPADPQVDDQEAPQPAWSPDSEQTTALAATAAQPAVPTITPDPELLAPAPAATESTLETSASALAAPPAAPEVPVPAAPAPTELPVAPAPPTREMSTPADHSLAEMPGAAMPVPGASVATPATSEAAANGQAAIASPPRDLSTTAVAVENVADSPGAEPTIAPTLAHMEAKPTAGKPAQALQLSRVEPPSAMPSATAEESVVSPVAIAPHPAAALPTPARGAAATAAPRSAAPDVAALRSRAATVQALLRDLRAAYNLEIPSAPTRPVSQPETVSRGPQLPQLPSTARAGRLAVIPVASPTAVAAEPAPAARQSAAQQQPQLPSFNRPSPNIALALPPPQPTLSTGRAVGSSSIEPSAVPLAPGTAPATTAQAPPSNSGTTELRDELRVAPLTTTAEAPRTFPPSPNAGIPSAFGANWGDVFFSLSLSGADRSRPEADGSLSMGFGLGDSRQAVGVELAYNLQSMRQFGENGGFDAKIHRQVYSSDITQVAAAVGLNNFASYGTNAGGESSPYGVVTAAHLLQPEHPSNRLPITASLGLGGGAFGGESSDVGVIAGVGLQVHPQFSINTAWSGVGVNVGASIVPVTTLPLTLNLLYGDVGNNTRSGSVAVLSIGYGFNFGPQF